MQYVKQCICLWTRPSCFLCCKIRHSYSFCLEQLWRVVPDLFSTQIGHLHMASVHIQQFHLWDTWPSLGPQSKSWQQSHQCQRERQQQQQKTPVLPYLEAFPSFSSHLSASLVGTQSLTSSCAHLTPDPSDILLWGQQARAHVTEKLYTTMVFASFPPFLNRVLPPPPFHPVSPLTPLSCPPIVFLYWSAVDGAWECLLCCCCQHFRLKEQAQTEKRCT